MKSFCLQRSYKFWLKNPECFRDLLFYYQQKRNFVWGAGGSFAAFKMIHQKNWKQSHWWGVSENKLCVFWQCWIWDKNLFWSPCSIFPGCSVDPPLAVLTLLSAAFCKELCGGFPDGLWFWAVILGSSQFSAGLLNGLGAELKTTSGTRFVLLGGSWTPLEMGGLALSHGEHRVSLVLPVKPRRSQDRLSIPLVREQHPGKTLGSLVTWIKAVFTSQSHLAQHIHTSFLLTGQTLKVQI